MRSIAPLFARGRARGRVPERTLWHLLTDGSEGVPEVVFRDFAAEDDAGDT
jgi:hypothetical protein